MLLMLLRLASVLSCPSNYRVLSGSRTLYYNKNTGSYVPVLILPSYALYFNWVADPDAQWVWWTTTWTSDTILFKDTFGLAEWAVNKVNTAVLKVAADDYMKVMFNGEELASGPSYVGTKFEVFNIKGKLKGSTPAKYQENMLEVEVIANAYYEGLIYRLDITFA